MSDNTIYSLIANTIGITYKQVVSTVQLLDEGATVPFISRYRKEMTYGLDEVQIEKVKLTTEQFRELEKRKKYILDTITEQGKLTSELESNITNCRDSLELEDLYLPYKTKRKTRATLAKENGLEPLSDWLWLELDSNVQVEAAKYITDKVTTIEAVLEGARDIIAERINEDAQARAIVRNQFDRFAVIYTKVYKSKLAEASKYLDYFEFDEPLKKSPSHRLLAMFRGEDEGFLKLTIKPDEDTVLNKLDELYINKNTAASKQLSEAITDCYDRLLAPSIENEFRTLAKDRADDEAILVFAENLRQLLLSAPLGNKRILAIDPGFRSGCKVVCLSEDGALLADEIIYPHEPQRDVTGAKVTLTRLVDAYAIEAIAIGNGTAGRETEEIVRSISFAKEVQLYMVNENGASVYSASEIAREEFPHKDVTVRGSVSIGRRLADPLAELVKIDPKAIGVGQYQHDVHQVKLKRQLDSVVESCVNTVGVNLNTASKSLLTYVSGLGPTIAQNIVNYRTEFGAFKSRSSLKKVPRLGEKAFEQCAGFLRIPNAKNSLDNSAVHPESYGIVEQMAKDVNASVAELIGSELLRKQINPQKYVTEKAGLPTINDIIKELAKPGRDPRAQLKTFEFANVKKPEDLTVGMLLPGIVTNITKFGCFVDVGVKQDGMVHISQLANKFVNDPNEVVKLQQQVQVKVIEIDLIRKRIALSMKEA
jgi:uncharacterized protein